MNCSAVSDIDSYQNVLCTIKSRFFNRDMHLYVQKDIEKDFCSGGTD